MDRHRERVLTNGIMIRAVILSHDWVCMTHKAAHRYTSRLQSKISRDWWAYQSKMHTTVGAMHDSEANEKPSIDTHHIHTGFVMRYHLDFESKP